MSPLRRRADPELHNNYSMSPFALAAHGSDVENLLAKAANLPLVIRCPAISPVATPIAYKSAASGNEASRGRPAICHEAVKKSGQFVVVIAILNFGRD